MQRPGPFLGVLAGLGLGAGPSYSAPVPTPAPAAATRGGRAPDPNGWVEPEDDDDKPRRPSEPLVPVDKHFAIGLHAGIIPPTFVVPAFWVRPIQHVAVGALGSYLPKSESESEPEPNRWTAGVLARIDFAKGNVSTAYCSAGYYAYREDAYEDIVTGTTTSFIPITLGYLWRGSFIEAQFGGGVLFWDESKDEPEQLLSFGVDFAPPILPTLELALRYRF